MEKSSFAHRKETLRFVPFTLEYSPLEQLLGGASRVCLGFQSCCLLTDPLDIADLAFLLSRNAVA